MLSNFSSQLMKTLTYRYPGITPFTTAQKEVFHGRENDIDQLFDLVNANKQTLLYSKSGIGKSSLINAGLIPKLSEKGYNQFTTLRFYAYQPEKSIALTENIVYSSGSKDLPETFLDKIIANENSLWYNFKKASLYAKKRGETKNFQLLIFDQFEEVFSYPEEEIFLFKKQLADLLYSDIPLNFRKVLEVKQRKQADLLTREEMDLLAEPLNIKVLFAIRDDRLSLVKQLSDYLPDILRIMYELKPLNREQAVRAIELPAQSSGSFVSPSFHFTGDAVAKIISFLTKENSQAVETTQLQILCNRCELIAAKENANNEKSKIEFTSEKIPDFEDVFIDFYFDVLEQLPEQQREKSQIFIENSLIIKEQRISLDQLICKDFITEKSLELLVNRHLLRIERNSTGGVSYELSHDTLVSPILQVKKQREEKEEEKRLEIERAEEIRLLKEKQRKDRNRLLLVVAALIFAIALSGVAFWQMLAAKKATAEAEKQTKIAEDALNKAYTALKKEALLYMQTGEYELAKAKFVYLRDLILDGKTNDALEKRISKCDELMLKKSEYNKWVELANQNTEKEDIKAVISNYSDALKTKINDKEIYLKLKDIKTLVDKRISEYSENAQSSDNSAKIQMWNSKAAEFKQYSSELSQMIKE